MAPLRVTLPAPAIARLLATEVSALFSERSPVRVRAPALEAMVLSLIRVTAPPRVLVPLTLLMAPALPAPAPLILQPPSLTVMPPWRARVAPDATVLFQVPACPKASLFASVSVPALTVTGAWKVLAPPSTRLPAPVLLSPL